MATFNDLRKYLDYEFSTGCYTGKDYLSFQRKYFNYLNTLCINNSWQLVSKTKGHYWLSAFIKDENGNCIYLSISDVRFWKNGWYNHILVRTAADEHDYHGGCNNYTNLLCLPDTIRRLFSFKHKKII